MAVNYSSIILLLDSHVYSLARYRVRAAPLGEVDMFGWESNTIDGILAERLVCENNRIVVFHSLRGDFRSSFSAEDPLLSIPKALQIAEMSMTTGVIQPGFMITHWQAVRYVGWTFLGTLPFIAALCAMFYTAASDALVSPKLKFGNWVDITLQGPVRTSYANPQFVANKLPNDNGGSGCW